MPRRGPKRPPQPPLELPLAPGERIELGALVKVSGLVDTGGEAKHRIQGGEVRVNGQVETRRGRKLVPGDRVEARGRTIHVVETRSSPRGGGAPPSAPVPPAAPGG